MLSISSPLTSRYGYRPLTGTVHFYSIARRINFRSGPKRYDYSDADDNWLYSRDGRALGDLLNAELSEALGQLVDIGLNGPASQLP